MLITLFFAQFLRNCGTPRSRGIHIDAPLYVEFLSGDTIANAHRINPCAITALETDRFEIIGNACSALDVKNVSGLTVETFSGGGRWPGAEAIGSDRR